MLQPINVTLSESEFLRRYQLNEKYLLSLSSDNLVRNYLFQAGLWSWSGSSSTTIDLEEFTENPADWHWGWESITSEIRGHFLGHWLAAASQVVACNGNPQLRGKIDYIVDQLARCQQQQNDGWAAAIPREAMTRMALGENVWAPHYTLHKLLMGLIAVHIHTANPRALPVAERMADWLLAWSDDFDETAMDDILDYETGGMLEVWADLYALTGAEKYQVLIRRYTRRRFFDALLRGEDVLTNKHANTQIAEILGAERVWETTGDAWYREVSDAFWHQAVELRGTYITGGVSCGELWMPPGSLASRLGETQEHCVVYNMIRLAHKRLARTGDPSLGDFIEKNLYNGILAQQHRWSGMVTYFLGMGPGSRKRWGSPTRHFWCCHGTLVQAHADLPGWILLGDDHQLLLAQYIPCTAIVTLGGHEIRLCLHADNQQGAGPITRSSAAGKRQIQRVDVSPLPPHRPECWRFTLQITCQAPTTFTLRLRRPDWTAGEMQVLVDGERADIPENGVSGEVALCRDWESNHIDILIPKSLRTEPLAGDESLFGFMDGPLVLAALTGTPYAPGGSPCDCLQPHDERHHSFWNEGYYIDRGGVRFIPLLQITDELYTVYFPRE